MNWTGLGVVVALVTVIASFVLQYLKAREDFRLKVAGVVTATDYPEVTKYKARALEQLFPGLLDMGFAERLKTKGCGFLFLGTTYEQRELLKRVVDDPASAFQTIQIWKAMFPDSRWLKNFENELGKGSVGVEAACFCDHRVHQSGKPTSNGPKARALH